MDSFNIDNIDIEPNETEIERYPADGLEIVIVDCGEGDDYHELLTERELDITVVSPDVPLSIYKYYEPLCILYSDGTCTEDQALWRRSSMEFFVQKVPIVAIGDSKDELLDVLGNATTDGSNNEDFGIYTFDLFSDDAAERVQYLAVHFNMQDNNYWDVSGE